MKRLVLSAVAVSMLAASALQGQAAPLNMPTAPQANYTQVDWKKPPQDNWKKPGHVDKRVVVKKKVVVVKRNHWNRGDKYHDWRRHQAVKDWQHRHLRRPGPGQEWIRVGNDYVLVGILSGVIAGVIAANH